MDKTLAFLTELIKFSLPALLVYFTVSKLLKTWIDGQAQIKKAEIRKQNETLTPIILQAHERLILLLERISPENLLQRSMAPGLTVFELQTILLQQLRAEYEHNLAQQLYINIRTWETIKNARQQLQHLIQEQAKQFDADTPSIELAKGILQQQDQTKAIIEQGIIQLKSDAINYLEK